MSKAYQWSVGEPCVRFRSKTKKYEKHIGIITFVTAVGIWPLKPGDHPFNGVPIRVFGGPQKENWFFDGADFRHLHGTDIRKLEEKYPEYVIKTNEVKG